MKIKKFKQMVEGAKTIDFESTVKEIAEMTDDNEHGAARIAGAKLLASLFDNKFCEELAHKYKVNVSKHMRARSLTPELSRERDKLDKDLFGMAKDLLTPEQYNKFHGSY